MRYLDNCFPWKQNKGFPHPKTKRGKAHCVLLLGGIQKGGKGDGKNIRSLYARK